MLELWVGGLKDIAFEVMFLMKNLSLLLEKKGVLAELASRLRTWQNIHYGIIS
jgi:hypothetical protein